MRVNQDTTLTTPGSRVLLVPYRPVGGARANPQQPPAMQRHNKW
jgi:hypothetical protein